MSDTKISDIKMNDEESKKLLDEIFKEVSIDEDEDPYEYQDSYDATNPQFPDRRWWLRSFPGSSSETPKEDFGHVEFWDDDDRPLAEKNSFPLIVEERSYTRVEYRALLEKLRRESPDPNDSDADLIEVGEDEEHDEEFEQLIFEEEIGNIEPMEGVEF